MFEAKDRGYRWGKFMPLLLWNYLYLARKMSFYHPVCILCVTLSKCLGSCDVIKIFREDSATKIASLQLRWRDIPNKPKGILQPAQLDFERKKQGHE